MKNLTFDRGVSLTESRYPEIYLNGLIPVNETPLCRIEFEHWRKYKVWGLLHNPEFRIIRPLNSTNYWMTKFSCIQHRMYKSLFPTCSKSCLCCSSTTLRATCLNPTWSSFSSFSFQFCGKGPETSTHLFDYSKRTFRGDHNRFVTSLF